MKAIYKKEFRSYFTSMIGYVFIAFFILVVGLYFSALNLSVSYPLIGRTLMSITFLFLIFVPILTMRSLSEEQRSKTDQLLYTAPISVWEIVAGKYFALLTVLLIPVAVVCCFPIVMEQYGTVNMPQSYISIFGFFCLGAAYLAIGLFLSSITESQIIAAVLTFGTLLFSYMVTGIASFFSNTAWTSFLSFTVILGLVSAFYYVLAKNVIASVVVFVVSEAVLFGLYMWNPFMFEGAIVKFLTTLDLAAASYSMMQDGILDLTDIVFYLSVIGLFLFFTIQTILKKRWND